MAARWGDSFGRSNAAADYDSDYVWSGGVRPTIETDGPWPSGSNNYMRFGTTLRGAFRGVPTASGSTALIQLRARWSSLPIASRVFSILEGSGYHFTLQISSVGSLAAVRGDYQSVTLAESAGGIITANTWYGIKVKLLISDTVGIVQVYVNDNLISALDLSNQDTRQGGAGTWNGFQWNGSNNNSTNVDLTDLLIMDGSGSANNAILPDQRVEWINAQAGNGANVGLTPSSGTDHGAMVDDSPSSDGDGTYNFSSTPGNKDTYALGNLVSTGTVRGAVYKAMARKTDSGTRGLTPVVRISGTDYDLTNQNVGLVYQSVNEMKETSPATSVAWTVSEINAMETGGKVA